MRFERIHPFQDGNGRVGRFLLFKECLRWDIVPFIIDEDLKAFYYRGLSEWDRKRVSGHHLGTCGCETDWPHDVTMTPAYSYISSSVMNIRCSDGSASKPDREKKPYFRQCRPVRSTCSISCSIIFSVTGVERNFAS